MSAIDWMGRTITYLRLSVTERCNMRCWYCMAEHQTFSPKEQVLSIEELCRLSDAFIDMGVRTVRVSGGEPLVRRGVETLFRHLGHRRAEGALDDVTVTTNGTRLAEFVPVLTACGVRRVNVSLDSLDPETFARLARRDMLAETLAGIETARRAGLKVKLDTVVQNGINDAELPGLVAWAGARGLDLSLIELMPLGPAAATFKERYLPLQEVRARLADRFTLRPSTHRTAGPSVYWRVEETGTHVGFIAPTSACFCDGCNRVRVTADGTLHPCLGQDMAIGLREPLRADPSGAAVAAAIGQALGRKPKRHHFAHALTGTGTPPRRGMHATGG